jgi:hypothetical protein
VKLSLSMVLLYSLLASFSAFAQQGVQHVIIVIQENRTPDILFGSDLADPNGRQLPNAHLAPTNTAYPHGYGLCGTQQVGLTPFFIDSCFDPNHSHLGWTTTWDHNTGAMDGACQAVYKGCVSEGMDTAPPCNNATSYCPQYTFADNSSNVVQPYFDIAKAYGFANYMFQTNQGPSFPAHQFLFSGTSAPESDINDPTPFYHEWFAEDNPYIGGNSTYSGGRTAPQGTTVMEISPSFQQTLGYAPPEPNPGSDPGFPCYTHPTLTTLLENANPPLSWTYYGDNANGVTSGTDIWTAPNAISSICWPVVNGVCTGTDFTSHVVLPKDPLHGSYTEPILYDMGLNNPTGTPVCGLAAVSWVIPDGRWSDHPDDMGDNGGPSWVAALVDALDGKNNDGSLYGRTENPCGYWDNTVILVVWDDWGGFYDDVDPNPLGTGNGGYSNGTGQQYVYGFRVPLLVVSKYAKQGYISGQNSLPPCPAPPGKSYYYCHDFGSILNFVEHTFGLLEINPSYHYADFLVRDILAPSYPYSLSDFFGTSARSFTPIIPPTYPHGYATSCFTTGVSGPHCFPNTSPSPPDDDVSDDD